MYTMPRKEAVRIKFEVVADSTADLHNCVAAMRTALVQWCRTNSSHNPQLAKWQVNYRDVQDDGFREVSS